MNLPIGPAQQINQVQQNPPLGPLCVLVAGPVTSPDGSDLETVASVISEGIGPQRLCGVIARTMAGTQVYAGLDQGS